MAAGYCMYSSSTILVLTMGNGVNGFTLDPQVRQHSNPADQNLPYRGRPCWCERCVLPHDGERPTRMDGRSVGGC